MNNGHFFEAMVHRVIHPFGETLKWANPKAYEVVRWEIARLKLMKRIFEKPMTQHVLLPLIVHKGDTVLDVGANTGQFTLPLARLVGAGGRVHSFEPTSSTFSELEMNVRRENLSSRVTLNQLALGESARVASLTVPQEKPTEATLAPHDTESWANYEGESWKYVAETCKVITIDDYVKEHHVGPISFLKCDVEGGELQVLKGGSTVLKSSSPPILMLEVFEGWTKSFGYSPRDILEFLSTEAGYEFYWIHEDGLKHVKPDDRIIPGVFWQWLDYLCLIPDTHGKRINVKRYLA